MSPSGRASVIAEAIEALDAGATIVYPTDTVYGLGCRAADEHAVAALRKLKGLEPHRPLSVLFAGLEQADRWVAWTPNARAWSRVLLPGPVTLVADAHRDAPGHIVAPDASMGVRVVERSEPVLLAADGPLVSTSTNRTGEPPCTTIAEARDRFGAAVARYVDVGSLPGPASTVLDVRGDEPRVLRQGALSTDQLAERIAHG